MKCSDVCGVPRAVVVEPVVGDRLLGTTGPVTGHNGPVINYGKGGGATKLENHGSETFAPPPQDRVKLFAPPPFKEWKLFAPPLQYC